MPAFVIDLMKYFLEIDKKRSPEDERAATRINYRTHIIINSENALTHKLEHIPAQMKDFSPRGAGLMVKRPFDENASIILIITNANREEIALHANVTRCHSITNDLFFVGVAFEGRMCQTDSLEIKQVDDIRSAILS